MSKQPEHSSSQFIRCAFVPLLSATTYRSSDGCIYIILCTFASATLYCSRWNSHLSSHLPQSLRPFTTTWAFHILCLSDNCKGKTMTTKIYIAKHDLLNWIKDSNKVKISCSILDLDRFKGMRICSTKTSWSDLNQRLSSPFYYTEVNYANIQPISTALVNKVPKSCKQHKKLRKFVFKYYIE